MTDVAQGQQNAAVAGRTTASNGTSPISADEDSIALTILDPDTGDPLTGFPVTELSGDITRPDADSVLYLWDVPEDLPVGTYPAEWTGTYSGVPISGQIDVVVHAPGLVLDPAVTFLTSPGSYDEVRALLGVTDTDLSDATINLPIYAPFVERLVKRVATDWAAVMVSVEDEDADRRELLRLAVVYGTAAAIARTNAKGGYLGLVRGEGSRTAADWDRIAEALYGSYELLRGEAAVVDGSGAPLFIPGAVGVVIGRASTDSVRAPWAPWQRPAQIAP